MKKCKACQKEIDPKASRCPFCQADQRNWFARHKVMTGLLVLVVLIIVIAVAGSGGSKSGTAAAGSSSPTPTPQAAIHVSAIQLASDYSANEVAADAKYKGNLLQVNGTVDSISNDFLNDPYVSLSDGKDDDGIGDAQCDFSQSAKSQLASLTKGQSVTVQGTDAGMTLETVSLQSCTLVQ